MRKIHYLIITLVLLSFSLYACGKSEPEVCEHQYDGYLFDGVSHWQVCSLCGEEISNEPHVFSEWKVIQEATEKEEGLMHRYCEVCNFLEEDIIERLIHECYFEEMIIEPTCEEEGYTLYHCECGNSYEDNFKAPTGHHMIDETLKHVTCEEDGCIVSYCNNCSYKIETIVPALEHKFGTWTLGMEPTKDSEGWLVRYCEHDESHNEIHTLPMLEDGCYKREEVSSPTCEEDGLNYYYYQIDDLSFIFSEVIKAWGHYYGEWEMFVEPTISNSGIVKRTCLHDTNHQEEIVLEPLNINSYQYYSVSLPTCEEDGLDSYSISMDGQTFTMQVVIEKIGHQYGEWIVNNEPSIVNNGSLVKVCLHNNNHRIVQDLPLLNDSNYQYECVIAATCETNGLAKYQYEIDGQAFVFESTIEALGHDYQNWVVGNYPTLITAGSLVRYCLHDESHQESVDIPELNETDYSVSTYLKPTCEEEGSKLYRYQYNHLSFDFYLPIKAYGHMYDGWSYNIDPTATTSGSIINRCRYGCGHFVLHELPLLNETSYEYNVYRAATCEEEGLDCYTYYYEGSGFAFEVKTAPLGHNYGEWFVKTAPTLTTSGVLSQVCVHDSKHVINETINPLNDLDYNHQINSLPTCETEGLDIYIMLFANQNFTFENVTAKLGHAYGEWEVVNNPTMTTTGLLQQVCAHDESHIVEHITPVLNSINYQVKTSIAQTCETEGLDLYTYTYANQSFTFENVTAKLGHAYGEWEVVNNPTMTTTGLLQQVCAHDERHIIECELPVLNGDDYQVKTSITQTCEREGLDLYTYTYANQSFTFKNITAPLGHNYGEWKVAVNPSVSNLGLLQQVCTHDNSHIIEYELPVLNTNDYQVEISVIQTCEREGLDLYTYTYANQSFTFKNVTAKLGHAYGEWNVINKPTITATGLLQQVCAHDSNHIISHTVPTLNTVNYTVETKVIQTCEREGLDLYTYNYDAQEFVFENVTAKLGHAYGEWEVVNNPTMTATGLLRQVCAHDESHVIEHKLPVLNNDDYQVEISVAQTCEAEGLDLYTYIHANQSFTFKNVTDMLGHAYGEWNVINKPTMTATGLLQQVCAHDNSHIVEHEMPVLNNMDYQVMTKISQTCEAEGLDLYTYNYDTQEFVFENITALLGHIYGDWIVDLSATENSVGQRSKHCSRCDGRSEITEIPMLPYTDGLEYELINDGTAYAISGIGIAESTVINITPVYNGLEVIKVNVNAFQNCVEITEIIVPNSVTFIGGSAFAGCRSLSSITLPFIGQSIDEEDKVYFGHIFNYNGDSVQSNYNVPASLKKVIVNGGTIRADIFNWAETIEEVVINSAITTIGDFAFSNCRALSKVTFTCTEQLKTIGRYAFSATNFSEFIIPASVETIGEHAFGSCVNLTKIDFGENSQVNIIDDYAFTNCQSLETIDFTNIPKLETIGSCAFASAGIKSLIIPDTVTSIGGAILASTPCEIIEFPSLFNQTLNYYFGSSSTSYSTYLKDVTIKNDTTINDYCFYYFKAIEEVKYLQIAELTSIGRSAFEECNNLKSFAFDEAVQLAEIGEKSFYNCTSLETINLSNTLITTIPNSAFYKCSGVKVISLNNMITLIGSSAFYNCSSVEFIDFSESLTTIKNNAFDGCINLKEINIPNSVTMLESNAFKGCEAVTKVSFSLDLLGNNIYGKFGLIFTNSSNYIHPNVKEVVITGGTALGNGFFKAMPALEKVTMPSSLAIIYSDALMDCPNLHTVEFAIDSEITELRQGAFRNCTNLSEINLGDLSKLTTIGYYVFYNCSSLTNVVVPEVVQEIGSYAFAECISLTEIDFSLNTSLKYIRDYTFQNCNLQEVSLPRNMSSVGTAIFAGNNEMRKLDVSCNHYQLYTYFGSSLADIPSSLTEIGIYFFGYSVLSSFLQNYAPLEKVVIGNQLKYIGDNAFLGCENLTSIEVEEGSILEEIGNNAFANLNIPYFEAPESLKKIGASAFENSKLTAFRVPSSVTYIGSNAFAECNDLASFEFINAQVNGILAGTFKDCLSLTSIVFPNSLISFGSGCLEGCVNLQKVTIPFVGNQSSQYYIYDKNGKFGYLFGNTDNSTVPTTLEEVIVTGGSQINDYAFEGCSNIKNVTLPAAVAKIGRDAFKNCSSLEKVYYMGDIDKWIEISFSNQYSNPMYYADDYAILNADGITCDNLTEVVIPTGVTEIKSYTFYNQKNLVSVEFVGAVQRIGTMAFAYCNQLSSLSIPKSVYNMGSGVFAGCTSLASLTIPFAGGTSNTAGSIGLGYLFGVESNFDVPEALKEVTLTNPSGIWGMNDCQYIEKIIIESGQYLNSFANCYNLKEIVLPDTLTTIYGGAFTNCSSLTSIYIPALVSSVSGVGDTFAGCDSLYTIIVDENNTTYDSRDNCNAIIDTAKNCLMVGCNGTTIPETVAQINDYAFNRCNGIEEVNIPEGVKTIRYNAFNDCDALTAVTIPSTATTIYNRSFYDCNNIVSFIVDYNNEIYDSRNNCNALIESKTNKLIKAFNTEVVPEGVIEISANAFDDCTLMTSLHISSTVSKINDTFKDCDSLTTITVSSANDYFDSRDNCNAIIDTYARTLVVGISTTVIPETISKIGSYAFVNRDSLTSITIPKNIIELGDHVFAECSNLITVIFAEGSLVKNLEAFTFTYCENLVEVFLPEGLEVISSNAFSQCTSLTTLTLPESLVLIESYAFLNTTLTELVIPNAVTAFGDGVFYNCSQLKQIVLPEGITTIPEELFYKCTSLEKVVFEGNIKVIERSAFAYCSSIKEWIFQEGLEEIQTDAFIFNYALEKISLPKSLEKIGHNAFDDYSLISELHYNGTLSDWLAMEFSMDYSSGIVDAQNFYLLNELGEFVSIAELVIPESVIKIGDYAFGYIRNFDTLTLPLTLETIGDSAFKNFPSTGIVYYNGTIADWVKIGFNSNPISNGAQLFLLDENGEYYSLTKELVIPEGVEKIGDNAFYNFEAEKIVLPSTIKEIGVHAFYLQGFGFYHDVVYYNGTIEQWLNISFADVEANPANYTQNFYVLNENGEYAEITQVIVPETVTEIGYAQFVNLRTITSVVLPKTVTTISDYAFDKCYQLTAVYYCGNSEEMNLTIGKNNTNFNNATKYYYSEEEPTEEGNYWHYAEDGVTIEVW